MPEGASRYPTSEPTSTAEGPARRLRLASYKWRKGRRRRATIGGTFRLTLWALAYLVVSGLLVWACLWFWPPRAASLVLAGAGYETNLAIPQNVYGRVGLDSLKRLTQVGGRLGRPGRLSLALGPRTVRKREPWDRGLVALPGKTAIVVLALHGGTDPAGAYLLPDDADARPEGNNRIRLENVIDRFALPPFKDKHVVLVLDATRITANWPLGMLQNDFARALEKLNDRIRENPHLIVLSASGIDQRSWTSDDFRQSIFLHFLVEGLQGSASGDDGRVDAADLFRYTSRRVADWVRAHRGVEQTPILLPRGASGLARASKMDLVVARPGDVPPAPPPDPTADADPPDLIAAWASFERLKGQSPPPAAHAPQVWTRYVASLLRFDELRRAGDVESGRLMLRRLAGLEREINDSRYLALGSTHNTLTMAVAEGQDPPTPTDADIQRFNALRGIAPEEAARRWAQLQTGPGAPNPDELRSLRVRLDDMILGRLADDLTLDRVAGSPADELARAAGLVKAIEDPALPRPAEVHDLVMIQRDAPSNATPGFYHAVGLALKTRRLAERTASALPPDQAADSTAPPPSRPTYSAQVFPWIQGPLAQADEQRRLGTDLLFSTEPGDWDRARDYLETASRSYQDVAASTAVVREALAIRDEVLPVLPGYARWLARWTRDGDGLIESAESLWEDLHALVRAVEAGDPDFGSILRAPSPRADDPRPVSLADRVKRVRSGYDALARAFAVSSDRALRAESADAWGILDDALHVPFVDFPADVSADLPLLTDPDRPARFKLIADARRVGRRVLGKAEPRPAEAQGRRESRLALATLGRRWFEQGAGPDDPSFGQARDLTGPALAGLGARVGARWRAIPEDLVKTLNAPRPADRAGELPGILREADHLARSLDAAGAETLARHTQPIHLPGALAPTLSTRRLSAHRRYQTRTFLLGQADRTIEDHWAADRDVARPYYVAAGSAYLADADDLNITRTWPEGPLVEVKTRLDRPDRLRLEGPTRYAWTSERQVDFAYTVRSEPADARRPGFPVLWIGPAEGLKTASPRVDARFPFPVGPGHAPRLPTRLEDPPGIAPGSVSGKAREATSTAHGLFRGQRFALTTRIDLHPTPETVAGRSPRPNSGRVSVRAEDVVFERSGLSRGAVAVVLDASGSMGPPEGKAFDASTRYATATRALEQVLKEMPAGTTVSLYVFGAAVPGNPEIAAEQTIRTIRPPTRWDPTQLAPLMAQISYPKITPDNQSPILRTMLVARDDLLRLSDVGLKTMVVITDGVDNRFEVDPLRGPEGKDVAKVLAEKFKDSGIQINFIAIPQSQPDLLKKLQDQFHGIESLPVAGRFYDANRPLDLVTSLRTVFRQELTYRVVRDDRQPIAGISALDVTVSRLDADDIWSPWPLPPGGYRVQINGETPQEAPFALEGGDLLLLTLGEHSGSPTFRRGLFAQEFFPNQPAQTDRAFRWRLSALQNQLVDNRGLRLLTTLERLADDSEGVFRLPRPREVWLEVTPGEESKGQVALRWSNREGYPAPAWSLDVADWPRTLGTDEPARPVLRAWWREGLSSPPADTLDGVKQVPVSLPIDADREIDLPGGTVVLRGVSVEDHEVEIAPGERKLMPCLVVRISHPKGKPVWVHPRGVNAAGWEHRFYTSADAYTGLFWTKSADEAFTSFNRLDLIRLDTFKRTCEDEGGYIELPLDAPRSGSTAPPPFEEKRAAPGGSPFRPREPRGIRR